MLLRFGLENHNSFRDPAELSFVSTSQADSPPLRLRAELTPYGVLPVVGVWGANASGKSNLLQALRTFTHLVEASFSGFKPEQAIPWHPFAMRRGPNDSGTCMEIDLIVDGIRYHYGIRFNATNFLEEWLHAWPRGRQQVLFHRDHEQAEPWYFGPSLKGPRKQIADATRPNSLYLSAAAQYNHKQISPIYAAITNDIRWEQELPPHGYPLFARDALILEPKREQMVLSLISAADLGIVGMRQTEILPRDFEPKLDEVFHPDFLKRLRNSAQDRSLDLVELQLLHGEVHDTSWELHPSQESLGTSMFLRRLEDFLQTLQRGGLLIFDEIEASLHPSLCAELVHLFTSEEVNRNGAQLLFTTHNQDLLATLRRDEVILVDKAPDGASSLRAASEYKGVRARDNLRQAYKLGRIGGTPVLGNLARVIARELGDNDHAPT